MGKYSIRKFQQIIQMLLYKIGHCAYKEGALPLPDFYVILKEKGGMYMEIQRCPECGIRLKNNYCDVCMKRVPFKGLPVRQQSAGSSAHRMEKGHSCVSFEKEQKVPWGGSSAHRMEKGHACVTFDKKEKKTISVPVPGKNSRGNKKIAPGLAVFLLLLSLLPNACGIISDLTGVEEPVPEPAPVVPYQGNVPAVEPSEIYSANGLSVVVDYADIYYDDYTVFMSVINESSEKIVVGTDLLSVNGYMFQSSFYAEVEAGDTVQSTLQLYSWELERAAIEEVAEIAFYLNIYQADYSDMVQSELIVLETEAMDTYEQPAFMDGWDLYTGEDVAVRLVSYGDNGGNYDLQFYMENLSEDTLSVSTESIRVNGEVADGYLWDTLRSGTRSRSEVFVSVPGLDDLGEIEDITLDLLIEHTDGYEITHTRTETVTFVPQN